MTTHTPEETRLLILDGICPTQGTACPDDCPIIPERGTPARCRDYYQTMHPMSDEMRSRYESDES